MIQFASIQSWIHFCARFHFKSQAIFMTENTLHHVGIRDRLFLFHSSDIEWVERQSMVTVEWAQVFSHYIVLCCCWLLVTVFFLSYCWHYFYSCHFNSCAEFIRRNASLHHWRIVAEKKMITLSFIVSVLCSFTRCLSQKSARSGKEIESSNQLSVTKNIIQRN